MTNTGIHALRSELDAVGRLAREHGTSKSRIVRVALLLAGEVSDGELRAAISGLDLLNGQGSQSGVFLTVRELDRLDRVAELAGESRSRLARAAIRLLVDAGAGQQVRLLASLPQDGRLKTAA